MTVERTHFVQPDYAHVAVDLLLKAPFRLEAAQSARTILLFLLVEHQSRPQRFFMLRLAEYVLEAYKMQRRAWEKIETLADVVEAGELFEAMIPTFKPHFLNLGETAPETLREGGFFGLVLWLIHAGGWVKKLELIAIACSGCNAMQ